MFQTEVKVKRSSKAYFYTLVINFFLIYLYFKSKKIIIGLRTPKFSSLNVNPFSSTIFSSCSTINPFSSTFFPSCSWATADSCWCSKIGTFCSADFVFSISPIFCFFLFPFLPTLDCLVLCTVITSMMKKKVTCWHRHCLGYLCLPDSSVALPEFESDIFLSLFFYCFTILTLWPSFLIKIFKLENTGDGACVWVFWGYLHLRFLVRFRLTVKSTLLEITKKPRIFSLFHRISL